LAAPSILARSHSVPDYREMTSMVSAELNPCIVLPMQAPIPIPASTRTWNFPSPRYNPLGGPHERRSSSALVRSQRSYLDPRSGNFGHQVERHSHFVAHAQQVSESHIPRGISQPNNFRFSNTQGDPSFGHQQHEPSIGASTFTYNYALPSPEEFIAGLQVPGEFSAATVRHDLPPYYSPGAGDFPSNSLSANVLSPLSFPQITPNPQGNEDIFSDYEFLSDTEANC